MLSITVGLDSLTRPQRELLAGLILNYDGEYEEENKPSEQSPVSNTADLDPAAVFGTQMAPQPVSNLGPVLVVPSPPPAPAPGVEIDKNGFPWDARIHASSKALNGDGTWRNKRGVAAVVLAQVEAELKHLMSLPQSPLAPAATQVATMASVGTTAASPSAGSAQPPPPPPPPQKTPADLQQDYIAFVGKVSAAIGAKQLTEAQLSTCFQAVGIATLPQLGMRPDLVSTISVMVDGIIAGQTA